MSYAVAGVPGPLREQDGSSIDTNLQSFEPIQGYVRQVEFWNTTDVDVYVYINAEPDFADIHYRIPSGGAKSLDISANQQQTDSFCFEFPLKVSFKSVAGSGSTGAFWMHTTIGKRGRP